MTNSETYLTADGDLAPFPVLDQSQTGIEPGYRIVQVADGWVAIAARSVAQVAALCAVAGVDDPAGAPSALGSRSAGDVLAALAAAGVPAELVRQNQRNAFFDSATNQAAGLVARYPHPVYGMFEQPGAYWAFGDLDVRLDKAPPALGQHSVEILEELGLSRDEIDRLVAEGVANAFSRS
jgi:crotonobetainyl-CoA:carnitine CoA-transferase CaiB-like acyl-CoA transferase